MDVKGMRGGCDGWGDNGMLHAGILKHKKAMGMIMALNGYGLIQITSAGSTAVVIFRRTGNGIVPATHRFKRIPRLWQRHATPDSECYVQVVQPDQVGVGDIISH